MKVVVASKNPVKLNTTKLSFEKYYDKVEIIGITVESGVSDQPMTESDTYAGAFNRATNAKDEYPDADFWVGIEGGIETDKNEKMRSFAWIIILDKNDQVGKSRSSDFPIPDKVANLVKEGKELGDADDIVFGRSNSKQKNGAIGILTHDVIDRTKFYEMPMTIALIPFINPELFN